jgi:hypothetical protein
MEGGSGSIKINFFKVSKAKIDMRLCKQ